MDITYYATRLNINKFKLLVILAFNRDLFKSILCNITIIQNENKETFIETLNYLKLKYNWNPANITIDNSLAEKKAINYVFPNCTIIPFFFHFEVNLAKHFKEIKSKNK